MCGIAGIVSVTERDMDPALLRKMTDLIAYRGPDSEGFLLAEPGGKTRFYRHGATLEQHQGFAPRVGLGHRRLSILDLSEAGCQPMSYDNGNYWIVYNGEVYNYVELRQDLERLGFAFQSHTDTEVILAAYAAWGCDCMKRFNGMWAFALLDMVNGRLVCSRDHMGIKPFYYRWSDGILYFGSEIKQLLLNHPAKADSDTLFDFLAMSGYSDHLPQTCFQGVFQLPASHCLTLDLEGGTPHIYPYDIRTADPARRPPALEEAIAQVRDTLSDSVRLRLRSDVPVGSCLSGGMDSSFVVSLMSRLRDPSRAGTGQHTFTFVSSEKRYDESYFADLVATAANVIPHKITPSPEEVRADLLKQIWHQDEPTVSMSTLAQWFVFKDARANRIPVMLDGQGGDELFLGYDYFHSVAMARRLKKLSVGPLLRDLRLTAQRSSLGLTRQLFQLLYYQTISLRAVALRSKSDTWLRRNFSRSRSMSQRLKVLTLRRKSPDMELRVLAGIFNLLRYEDRNSMAFSIEARLPMLDNRLIDLALHLPLDYKLRDGWAKYVLRRASEGILPREVTWRTNKFGFNAPQNTWLKLLDQTMRETLGAGDLAAAEYLDVKKIRDLIRNPQAPPTLLWRAFNLEQWFRLFNVQTS